MKKLRFLIILFIGSHFLQAESLTSPDNNFNLTFNLSEKGEPVYSLTYKQKVLIKPSGMGFELLNSAPMKSGFTLQKTERKTVDDTWKPVWGEVKEIRDNYNELLVVLDQKKEKRTVKIRFRLFNDGLGFRYEFDKQPKIGRASCRERV